MSAQPAWRRRPGAAVRRQRIEQPLGDAAAAAALRITAGAPEETFVVIAAALCVVLSRYDAGSAPAFNAPALGGGWRTISVDIDGAHNVQDLVERVDAAALAAPAAEVSSPGEPCDLRLAYEALHGAPNDDGLYACCFAVECCAPSWKATASFDPDALEPWLVAELLRRPRVLGLAEVMDIPAVLSGETTMLEKIEAARRGIAQDIVRTGYDACLHAIALCHVKDGFLSK